MTNTEKPSTKAEQKKQAPMEIPKPQKQKVETPIKEEKKLEDKTVETKKPEEKPVQKKPKVKKTQASINALNAPISTKYSVAICKFIKGKKIEKAILDLEQVLGLKKAVPMKGEIPHRKGKRMMSGRFPKKASEHFIRILKSLLANANTNDLDDPIVKEAIANMASRPYGRFGSVKRKRTHIKLIAASSKSTKKSNKKLKEKKETKK